MKESERLRKLAETMRENARTGRWTTGAVLEMTAISASFEQAASMAMLAEAQAEANTITRGVVKKSGMDLKEPL